MLRYISIRILWMIPIVLGVAVIVFTLISFTPGDPATILLGSSATQSDLSNMREQMGLNDPYLKRLGTFLYDTFFKFELGESWISRTSIKAAIIERLPRTMMLALSTLTFSVIIGIPLGIMAAISQGKWRDNVSMALALLGVSIPNFWLALMFILLFSVKLGWLPAMGIGGVQYYILPALSGCMGGIATLARQTRSSMLDVIRADYITTARSKGVPEFSVITRHALKNAFIPIITIIGIFFGRMLGGAMVIETIFAIPGMGSYIVTGVNSRDYPVVLIGSIFLAVVFSISMLFVDLIYAAIDPRIKARYAKKRKKVMESV